MTPKPKRKPGVAAAAGVDDDDDGADDDADDDDVAAIGDVGTLMPECLLLSACRSTISFALCSTSPPIN